MTAPPPALAVFDMDRTLVAGAVIHALAPAMGAQDQVAALVAARDEGRMTQQEVTLAVARLLRGLRPETFDALVAPLPLSPGAEEAVQGLREAGVALAICSDSYARAAEQLARRLGIGLWAANVLEVQDGAFTGELRPWARALGFGEASRALDKREAVPLLARKAGVPLERTVVVGDGVQDGLAMGLVGLGIAFNAVPAARRAAKHHLEGSLAPVPGLVRAWLRG